jgi:hypothetical protein
VAEYVPVERRDIVWNDGVKGSIEHNFKKGNAMTELCGNEEQRRDEVMLITEPL